MRIFIENYNANFKTVLFDFLDSNDFLDFGREIFNLERDVKRSMILLKNYSGKKLRNGSYYELNADIFRESFNLESDYDTNTDSYIVDAQITLNENHQEFIGKSKSITRQEIWERNIDPTDRNSSKPFQETGRPTKIRVKYVGQGSWNEVWVENKVKVVFDIGTSYHRKKVEVDDLVKEANSHYLTSNPSVVISHWDVDHYHCLKALSDDAVKSFRAFLFRDRLPNLTSRIIYSRIKKLNPQCLIAVKPFEKLIKGNRDRLIPQIKANHLIIYNSRRISSRNRNCLTMIVRTLTTSVVLPGDCHYQEVSDCMLPDLAYPHDNHLIVPHHGGSAGKVQYSLPFIVQRKQAVVSVGKNSYGHPSDKNIDLLRGLGFKICQLNHKLKDHDIKL